MDIVGNHVHTDGLSYLEMLVVLDKEFASLVTLCQHLIVYTLEDGRGNLAHKLGMRCIGAHFDVFRTDYDIYLLVASESLIHTRYF